MSARELVAELEAAEARAQELRRQIAAGPCSEYGHDWKSIGGANAGCGRDCSCSVPVNECKKCGDCDYGYNDDADAVKKECAEDRRRHSFRHTRGMNNDKP